MSPEIDAHSLADEDDEKTRAAGASRILPPASQEASVTAFGPWKAGWSLGVGSGAMVETADWLIARLPAMGVAVPPECRLHRARRLIHAVHERKIKILEDDPATMGRVADAQRTLAEFYIIVWAIRRRTNALSDLVRHKLRTMLGGAESELHDTNTLHRDTQFELYVYAQFLMGGASVSFAEPDLRFQFGKCEVGLAIKRLSSPKQLRKRVLAAAKQIESSNDNGFIAVNIDRLVSDLNGPRSGEVLSERGRRYNRRIAPLHALMPLFAERPSILGLLNFGYTYHWEFGDGIPRYSAGFFRQVLRFSDTPADVNLATDFFDGLSARIGNALREL